LLTPQGAQVLRRLKKIFRPRLCLDPVLRSFSAITASGLCSFLFLIVAPPAVEAQNKRMVLDGTIRLEGGPLPPTAVIRILHADTSVAKTVSAYDPFKGKFGARLSSVDGFEDNEKILFRVVLSAQDSFLARSVTPVIFKGSEPPLPAPSLRAELFRNHVPQLRRQMPDTVINENQSFRFRLIAIDLDGDTISYRIHQAPPGSQIDSITGLFAWKPNYDQAGTYELVFTVSDGFDADTSRRSMLTVRNVNRPPFFLSVLRDTVIRENESLRIQLKGEDPDSDMVRFSAMNFPQGAVFDSLSGWLEWTPTYDQSGQYTIVMLVLDGTSSGERKTARITVLNVNRPPVITEAKSDTTINENEELRLTYVGQDPDNDRIRFSLIAAPQGAMMTEGGLLTWKPNFLQAGDYNLSIALSDDSLRTQTTTTIHVKNVNRLPTLPRLVRPSETDTIVLNSNKPVVFTWYRSRDEDADDTLRYLVRIRGGAMDTTIAGIRDSSLSLSIRPRMESATNYTWTLSVSDGWVTLTAPESRTFRSSAFNSEKENLGIIPRVFSLEHNYPNPFNPTTLIRYSIPERSFVRLTVWNMLGELVQELVSQEKEAGIFESTFRAENLPSGVYLVKLEAHPMTGSERKDFISTKKMILVK